MSMNGKTREILTEVYASFRKKGYNPINQIVGVHPLRGPYLYYKFQ